MKLWRNRCPSPSDLERAFWSDDASVGLHVEDCSECRPQWQEMAGFADLGRAIQPEPSSSQRREEIRATLLSKQEEETAPVPFFASFWRFATPLAAAAVVAR